MILIFGALILTLIQVILELIINSFLVGKLKFPDFFSRWVLTYCFLFVIYFIIGFNIEALYLKVLIFISIAILQLYGYTLQPFIVLRDKKIKRSIKHEEDNKDILLGNKIYIHKNNFANAYAMGVLKFAKGIILSKSIIEKMDITQLRGVIAHEVGHLKKYHLLKLYISLMLAIAIGYFSTIYIYIPFNNR